VRSDEAGAIQPLEPAGHEPPAELDAAGLRWRAGANPGERPPHGRVSALVEVLLASDVPTQLLIMQVLLFLGVRPIDETGRLSLTYVWLLSMLDAALLIGLILLLLLRHRESPAAVFVGSRSPIREALLGFVLMPAFFFLSTGMLVLFQRLAPWLHNVPENPLGDLIRTPGDAALFGIVAVFAGGVREEIQRAFILHRFEQSLGGGLVGVVVFSVAFGAGHLIQGRDVAIITATLGAIWGVMYLRRRSVVAPAISHSAFNIAQIMQQRLLS
jgi:membrane protease YdiL (CAAX protease family)